MGTGGGYVPMLVEKNMEIVNLGRVGDGNSQSKQVYDPLGLCPTICSRLDKGNTMPMIVEDEMKVLGHLDENSNQRYVVYDKNEEAPTLQSAMGTGGGQTPYVAIDEQNMLVNEKVVGTLTTDGSSPKHNNRVLDRIRWRIRKLTPCECWLLMDFSEENFRKAEKVNSNSQLYKQAGNSICQNVLVAALGQLFEGKEDVYKTACRVKKLEPKDLVGRADDIEVLGDIYEENGHESAGGRVYATSGLAPSLGASHFQLDKYILEEGENAHETI